jgi:hypothetical protein
MSTQTEDCSTIEENYYNIDFVVNVITKEAPKEKRLTKQVLYTLFSAKSNDPVNLAINAPTGEGKTYVVQKVIDLFPKNDVICLVGMSEKALFHRPGILVIKNDDGNYISIEQKIKDIESQIQDYETEIANSNDKNLKNAKKHEIKDLEAQRKEISQNSKKLIELSGKTLIFLDSPPAHLLEALMPLLSHDRTEVEYEFVDTYNGIRTRGNVLQNNLRESDILINEIDTLESILGRLSDLKYGDKSRAIEIAEANNDFRQAIRLRKQLNKIQDLESEISIQIQFP